MQARVRFFAWSAAAVSIVVLVAAGIAGKEWIRDQWYIWKLSSGDQSKREFAAEQLGKIRSVRAVPSLAQVLTHESGDKNRRLRQICAGALGEIGPGASSAVPSLAKALRDDYGGVQAAAAEALGHIGPQATIVASDLIRALQDPNDWVRQQVTQALGQISSTAPETVSALIAMLDDNHHAVRRKAAIALSKLGPSARLAIPKLREILGSEDPKVRETVEDALTSIQHSQEWVNK
jgi:HEAT repeat protein